jgi:hypothetical protein
MCRINDDQAASIACENMETYTRGNYSKTNEIRLQEYELIDYCAVAQ